MRYLSKTVIKNYKKLTNGVGAGAPNKNNGFVCSKQTNLVALLGVSAMIGGRIPFQNEKAPSCKYIFLKQSKTPEYVVPLPEVKLFWSCILVLTTSNGCIMQTSMNPADPPAATWNPARFHVGISFWFIDIVFCFQDSILKIKIAIVNYDDLNKLYLCYYFVRIFPIPMNSRSPPVRSQNATEIAWRRL